MNCMAHILNVWPTSIRYGVVSVAIGLLANGVAAATRNVPGQYATIQAAVDAAGASDIIMVAPGTYGAFVVQDNARITIQSSGGAASTIIDGQNTQRCATLGASNPLSQTAPANTLNRLVGFTLRNGKSSGSKQNAAWGGAVLGGTVENCTIENSVAAGATGTASAGGGGAAGSILINCIVRGNTARTGGGARASVLSGCLVFANEATVPSGGGGGGLYDCSAFLSTIVNNTAMQSLGGGTCFGAAYNSIIWGNTASTVATENWNAGSFTYTCTAPLPTGVKNRMGNPSFVDEAMDDYRLKPTSICNNVGNNAELRGLVVDLDGNARVQHAVVDLGAYESAATVAPSPIRYVAQSDGDNMNDGLSWETAKATLQAGIDSLTMDHETGAVQVRQGTYAPISVNDAPIIIEGVDGRDVTIIDGVEKVGSANVLRRCATLGNFGSTSTFNPNGGPQYNKTVLSGFTLKNGNSQTEKNWPNQGGAVLGGTLTNCVITGSVAQHQGGGAAASILIACVLTGNASPRLSATWPGYGGGAAYSTLTNCTVTGNSAAASGSGLYACAATQCLIAGNTNAVNGAVFGGTLENCTVTANTSPAGTTGTGGTVNSACINTIVWGNGRASTNIVANYSGGTFAHSCSSPLPAGLGNVDSVAFTDFPNGDYRPLPWSGTVNAGDDAAVTGLATDFAGNARIQDGRVDMGIYEVAGEEISPDESITLVTRLNVNQPNQRVGSFNSVRDWPWETLSVTVNIIGADFNGYLVSNGTTGGEIYITDEIPETMAGLTGTLSVTIPGMPMEDGPVTIILSLLPPGISIDPDNCNITVQGLDDGFDSDDDLTIISSDGRTVPSYHPEYGYVTVPTNDNVDGGTNRITILIDGTPDQLIVPAGSLITPQGIIIIGVTTVDDATGKITVQPGGKIYVYAPHARPIIVPVPDEGAEIDPSIPSVVVGDEGPTIIIPDDVPGAEDGLAVPVIIAIEPDTGNNTLSITVSNCVVKTGAYTLRGNPDLTTGTFEEFAQPISKTGYRLDASGGIWIIPGIAMDGRQFFYRAAVELPK